jgi:hypothetical protein
MINTTTRFKKRTQKHTENCRRQQREHDTITRPIPLEHLTLHECLARAVPELSTDLLLCFTKRECLWLREEVAQQDAVMLRTAKRVVSRRRGEEVSRNEFGALMDELVE